ncbi:MAG TPA: class II aldolase/adducin family protein [Candidatus Baltobacteraceae bacterium]|nr:class II aldolase/adducin family protein [Candidatus Baltobacteraceae bacterium]
MTEEHARAQIVTYAQRLWDRGLVSGTSGNVSVRLDDGDVLATPASRCLGGLLSNDIVRVAADGTPRNRGQRPTSELPLHLVVYRCRSDARCVVHVHPTFCVVWSLFGTVFPQETVGARETLGQVAWTAYRPAGSQDLADLCGAAFADGTDVVLMERHGLSAIGPELENAFVLVDQAEEAARVAYFFRIGENA